MRWKIGDGTNINFWLDNWCHNHCLADLTSVPDISSLDTSPKVSHFILPSKAWDILRLQQLVSHTSLQVILAIPIPYNPIPDSIYWGLFGSGDFFTKYATWAAHGLDMWKCHF